MNMQYQPNALRPVISRRRYDNVMRVPPPPTEHKRNAARAYDEGRQVAGSKHAVIESKRVTVSGDMQEFFNQGASGLEFQYRRG